MSDKESEDRKVRICMLAYTFYETDNRVKRYAATLAQQGHAVDVVCLRKPKQSFCDIENSIRVIRIQRRSITNENTRLSYLLKLLLFLVKSFFVLSVVHMRKRYDLIHVHNVPDFLVFSTLIPKLTGAKIILDIHDILPELYLAKFNAHPTSLGYRALLFVERVSAKWADQVIVANHVWHSRYASRSAEPKKCTVIMNYPDPLLFSPRKIESKNDEFTFIYPGNLAWHQGVDVAVRAFSILSKKAGECRLVIFGNGSSRDDLIRLVAELGLQERVLFRDTVPITEIAKEMAKADCGIEPKRSGGFAGEAFSTKILEFMAVNVPVIVSETTIHRYYFDDSLVLFFNPENVEDLARKMELMMTDPALRKNLAGRGMVYAQSHSWDQKKVLYNNLISSLLSSKPNGSHTRLREDCHG